MPLTMLNQGDVGIVQRIQGPSDIKKHLEDLGFVTGETVRVISELAGNLIIELKGTRLALSKVMANHIILKNERSCKEYENIA